MCVYSCVKIRLHLRVLPHFIGLCSHLFSSPFPHLQLKSSAEVSRLPSSSVVTVVLFSFLLCFILVKPIPCSCQRPLPCYSVCRSLLLKQAGRLTKLASSLFEELQAYVPHNYERLRLYEEDLSFQPSSLSSDTLSDRSEAVFTPPTPTVMSGFRADFKFCGYFNGKDIAASKWLKKLD